MLLVDLENTLVFLKKGFDRSLFIFKFFFNYCPLAWHFTSMASTNKIESVQKRALRLLSNDYTSTCDSLLAKAKKPSMELKRYQTLVSKIFKTLNVLNPTYMQNLFDLHSLSAGRPII